LNGQTVIGGGNATIPSASQSPGAAGGGTLKANQLANKATTGAPLTID